MGLSTIGFAAVAQRRVFGLFATPDLFRPNQSPLGAGLLPQALISRRTRSVAGGPFVSSGWVALWSTCAESRTITFILAETPSCGMSLNVLLTIAIAMSFWR